MRRHVAAFKIERARAQNSLGIYPKLSTSKSNSIEGKIVVITGASSGLGESAARLLSAQGASVVLGASIASNHWRTN
jgi:NADPH:quinone reductase-like Zn-dependent oxidoreductase